MQELSECRTALHKAVDCANSDLVEVLCSSLNATVQRELLLARDKFGRTALNLARQALSIPYHDHKLRSEIVELIESAYAKLGIPLDEEEVDEESPSDIETEANSDMDDDDTSDEDDDEPMDTAASASAAAAAMVAAPAVADALPVDTRPGQ